MQYEIPKKNQMAFGPVLLFPCHSSHGHYKRVEKKNVFLTELPPNQQRLRYLQAQTHLSILRLCADRRCGYLVIQRRTARSRVVPADTEAGLCHRQEKEIAGHSPAQGTPAACLPLSRRTTAFNYSDEAKNSGEVWLLFQRNVFCRCNLPHFT